MYYDYDYGYGYTGYALLDWLWDFLAVLVIVLLAIGALCYIFQSIGLYTLAKRRGVAHPGLAWVPVGSSWILGSVADDYDNKINGTEKKMRLTLLWMAVGEMAAAAINSYATNWMGNDISWPVALASAVMIVFFVFYYMALYKVYLSCTVRSAVTLLVLSILFPLIIPFVLFSLRNKDAFIPRAYVMPVGPAPVPPMGGGGVDGQAS